MRILNNLRMTNSRLSTLIQLQAEKYGERTALRYRDYSTNTWVPVSWNNFSKIVNVVSNSLIELGVKEQENIGIFSQNKPECLYADFGSFGVRAVTIPFYATSSESQVHYIVEDASVRYVFVGEQFQYDVAFRVQKINDKLKKLIIFDRSVQKAADDTTSIYFDEFLKIGEPLQHSDEVRKRIDKSDKTDIANILYTSGTTGEPKGVMINHSCYEAAFPAHEVRLGDFMSDKDIVLSFLPYTHIFERAWTYLCLLVGCEICVNLRPSDIQKTMREIRPTLMCSVPRFWEKVYSGVIQKIEATTGYKKLMMQDALKVGRKYNLDYLQNGLNPPLFLKLKYKFYEKTIYSLLKKAIGIERGNFFPTAGAAIPQAVEEFVHSVGINMITGYGLTETTASVSCEIPSNYRIGSVGVVMPGVEIKIGENNEILVKGDTVTSGYYNKCEQTKEAFTEDGFFRTGDSGYLKDGKLYLTERLKDLFKTSNGKYIAPQALESKLVVDKYIDQIAVIADQHKFVSALIIPEYKLVEEYAKQNNITYSSINELLEDEKIIRLFTERIETLQQQFAHYEKIKRFVLLSEPFSMENGELTNTLKIRRNVINKNYAKQIQQMYAE